MSIPTFNSANLSCLAVILAGLAGAFPGTADASERGLSPMPIWEITYPGGETEIEHLAGTVDSNGDLWLLVGRRPRGVMGGPQDLELWTMGANGDKRLSRPLEWKDAPPIQSQRALGMLTMSAGISLALPTSDGLYLVTVPDGGGVEERRHIPAVSDAELIAMVAGPGGHPAFVTTRGLVSYDTRVKDWLQTWRLPHNRLILDASAATADRVVVLLRSIADGPQDHLAVVALQRSDTGIVATHPTRLGPGGAKDIGTSLIASGNGDFTVAARLGSRPGETRWRLTTLDSQLNLRGSSQVDLPPMDLARTTLTRWNSTLVLATPETDAGGPVLVRLDDQGFAAKFPGLAGRSPAWRRTERVSLYPDGRNNAYLIESARTLERDASRTRSELRILKLPGDNS